ncbi:MAG: T9SS type A sorting domain-containing protein [Bacteroidia bacterium]
MKTIFTIFGFCLFHMAIGQQFTAFDLNSKGAAYFGEFTEIGQKAYFSCATVGDTNSGIWVTDGTPAGTHVLSKVQAGGNLFFYELTALNNHLIFKAERTYADMVNGIELWHSDGTTAGTNILKDIWPGSGSSVPEQLYLFNGEVFFRATDSLNGTELWKTDGTANGTILVKNIAPGAAGSFVDNFTALGNQLFFSAYEPTTGNELWVTDGTPGGTHLFLDINATGNQSAGPRNFYVYQGKLYFTAESAGTGAELWVSDGTVQGTTFLKDINPGPDGSGIREFYGFNGKVYFNAQDDTHGEELWVTDGTSGGTYQIKDIHTGSASAYPLGYMNFQGHLYFSAYDDSHGNELWYTDGTEAGTQLYLDIIPGSDGSNPASMTTFGDSLYFVALEAIGDNQMFVTAGDPAQTHVISPPGNTAINPLFGLNFTVFNPVLNSLFFSADYDQTGQDMWQYTDASGGVGIEKQIKQQSLFSIWPNPADDIVRISSQLYPVRPISVEVTDLQGKITASESGFSDQMTIDISTLSPGLYMLKLQMGNSTSFHKLVIK